MKICIADSHNDWLTELSINNYNEYIKDCKKANVNFICSAVYTTEKNYNIGDILNYNKILNNLSKNYKINLLLSVEDLSFIQTQDDVNNLIKLMPFSTTLTWNNANIFAGGCNSALGLSTIGKNLVQQLEVSNILVDTAHLNRKSFYDICKISTKPLFNSHTNINSIYPHPRNLDDNQIEEIVKSNGFLGITLYEKFISNTRISSVDIARQLDYLVCKFGLDNFGFGSDFFGINPRYLPTDINNYFDFNNIIHHLYFFGYSEVDIRKLMHDNFAQFVKRHAYIEYGQ